MAKLTGGGILGNKNVKTPVRTGSPRKGSSPASANQLGQATYFKKEMVESKPAFNSGIPLGNERALDKSRTVMRSGSQSLHGPVNRGEGGVTGTADRGPRAILNEKKG
jgi:hypothetical protein